MTEPDTEARVAQSQWLDSLDDYVALRVMLASQAGAAAAVERPSSSVNSAHPRLRILRLVIACLRRAGRPR